MARVDDRLPLGCVERVRRADLQTEEGVLLARAGLLFGGGDRLRLGCVGQVLCCFIRTGFVGTAGRRKREKYAYCKSEAGESR